MLAVLLCTGAVAAQQHPAARITSPDKHIEVQVFERNDAVAYLVRYHGQEIIHPSHLGLATSAGDFSTGTRIAGVSPVTAVHDQYELFTGKKRRVTYQANKGEVQCTNNSGNKISIVFQVSNDGVAFRYQMAGTAGDTLRITQEHTSFVLDTSARGFLQPMQVAKTGFEQSNPAYEDNYRQHIPVTTRSSYGAGWIYPALFECGNNWALLTEAGLDGTYCATRLLNEDGSAEYRVGFPDPRETIAPDGLVPRAQFPFYSPWRIITIGSLATIAQSTLGTDVAPPAITMDTSFIHPGKASWSWIMSKDDSIVYSEQIRYIDFAADMHWQYCLVDAAWDAKIGYDKARELAGYAQSKGIGLLLWYNSAGNWNTVKYTPRDKLLTHESRMKEFTLLKEMGVKGVKIDFFGGDGRSVIQYYIDILKDAATVGLLVNFHGATLPRGWSRTYPHLLTTEAVKGFEMITFNQRDADVEANHSTMLPFTRNAFDPMDFTSGNLYKIPTRVQRRTTSAFELATSVVFLSGIHHIAESPAGMTHVPQEVQDFLRTVPVRWDEVQLLDGYPGKYVVIARKAGNKWYIGGMNGEAAEKKISLSLKAFHKAHAQVITDGDAPLSFTSSQVATNTLTEITMKPNGGFVIVLE